MSNEPLVLNVGHETLSPIIDHIAASLLAQPIANRTDEALRGAITTGVYVGFAVGARSVGVRAGLGEPRVLINGSAIVDPTLADRGD